MDENSIGRIVVDCSVKLHMATGPGLFESVYEVLLGKLLETQGLRVQQQVFIPIHFQGYTIEKGFRADIVIENKVILELKSVEKICPAHHKQLVTYLKLSNLKLGFLLNFGAPRMKDGISRVINGEL
jgi:GxxExxY protein